MLRRSLILSCVIILLAATVTHAYPLGDEQIRMTPFWQRGNYDILGCRYDDLICKEWRRTKTISQYGCALTSMAMLYMGYGFWLIPDEEHSPQPIYNGDYITNRLKPSSFNQYLSAKDLIGRPLGFVNFIYDFDWLKTTSNFYYYFDVPSHIGHLYKYLVPNYDCAPINIQVQKKNGTFETVKRSAGCYRVDWSTPGAMTWLDYDINWGGNYAPPIMKIKYTDSKEKRHDSHFVVIGGYEKKAGRAGDIGWYRAHNPSFKDNEDNIPKALNGETQYGMKDHLGRNVFHFDGMVTLYRFTGRFSDKQLDTSNVDVVIRSPVEVQVIDPDGNLIGYDPETGTKFLENPMSLYYEETPVTALDGTDTSSEPYKRLTIIQPRQGNYILKLFGTGDGPYTINMDWTKADGTANLVTSLTGTATPSLSETYRVTYSPTGEASLSQTNQAPVANAGSNQTGEQSYEITLDGSGSSDPDGDPLKYAWSFASKPEGSTATLSNVSAVNPTFIPDKPGTYTLQLVVNDYFTDSTPSTGLSTNANHSAAFGRSQCKLKIGNCKFVVWPEAINCL